MSATTTTTTGVEGYVAIPRALLLDAIAHCEGSRFDYPGHRLAPKLRPYANATAEQRPLTDQRTLADVLRRVAVLVHVDELPADAGRAIVMILLPHASGDSCDELLHTAGVHYDLDNAVIDWQYYDPDLPWQAEPRQTVATDLASQDLEALIWTLLNPGERRCVNCHGPGGADGRRGTRQGGLRHAPDAQAAEGRPRPRAAPGRRCAMTWSAHGPFESGRDALEHATWRHVDVHPYTNEAWRAASYRAHRQRLHEAIARTGTPTSEWEDHLLDWLANWESSTVELFASLIERAFEAGARHAGGAR